MNTDAYSRETFGLKVQVESSDHLVQGRFGRTIRIPSSDFIIRDRANSCGDVDPLGKIGGFGRGRWKKLREMLDEQHVGDDVQLKSLVNILFVEIRRLAFGVKHASGEECGVYVGFAVGGQHTGELFGSRLDAAFGGKLNGKEVESVGVNARILGQARKYSFSKRICRGCSVSRVDGEFAVAKIVSRQRE